MSGTTTCRTRIDDAGFPGRTEVVLERERALFGSFAAALRGGGDDEPTGGAADVSVSVLESALETAGATGLVAAAFVAGRCDTDDAEASRRIDDRLRRLVDKDEEEIDLLGRPYVEALFSLVLRGHEDEAVPRLRHLVTGGGAGNTHDWLAAVYLAEMGDLSGWPVMIAALEDRDAHTRLMATRHLVHFAPYDGSVVDGKVIDVWARLLERLADEAPYVAREVPGLLAEVGGDGLVEVLRGAASTGRHEEVREAAEDVLDDLGSSA